MNYFNRLHFPTSFCKTLCVVYVALTFVMSTARAEAQVNAPIKPMQKKPAAERTSINNMREICLATVTYIEANKKFPTNSPAKEGGPVVSWRVRILPYIEDGRKIFGMYKMDEPWDSDSNKKVLAMMPAVYRHPKQDPKSTNSSYFAVAGKEGILATCETNIKVRQITDGMSKTLLVVHAEREIPWTKPEDIQVEQGRVPELGLKDATTFDAATADARIHTLSKKIDADVFWKMFTRNGGETVDWDKIRMDPATEKAATP